jgi:hypothetical protein
MEMVMSDTTDGAPYIEGRALASARRIVIGCRLAAPSSLLTPPRFERVSLAQQSLAVGEQGLP